MSERPICEACHTRYVWMEDIRDYEPACSDTCDTCAQCGTRLKMSDPNAPQIASSDEEAEKYDPSDTGACGKCWDFIKKHGHWPGQKRKKKGKKR